MYGEWNAGYVDTHAHLAMIARRGIAPERRIPELAEGGFGGIIDIGTEADDLPGRTAAFASLGCVKFCGGIWPSPQAIALRQEQCARLEAAISRVPRNLIAAVGECGLDRFHNTEASGVSGEAEEELLELQLDLAKRLDLPVIIHSREAAEETHRILARHPSLRKVIHCFSYGPEEVRRFLDLGCYISFAGNLTYKNAAPLREALPLVPADRLLLETDAPFLAPAPFRGKTAEPGMVAETYALAAELRKTALPRLITEITRNVGGLFSVVFSDPADGLLGNR